ncbi:fibronectin type III domain-containing protein [Streptomyces sp. NPDC045369]|uniref:fibronectin type III domain-containing protein n=1 Tax=Streptomyces sp. NPDC045369 TaxID=3155732 RepID=UPI0033F92DDD
MAKQYVTPEWESPGEWYGTMKATVWNFESEPLVDPEISFRVQSDQNVTNVYGLVWQRSGNVITGRLVPERKTVPPRRGTQEFRLGFARSMPGPGPLPTEFKINGQPADVPDDATPPSVPTQLRVDTLGPTQATLSWTPSTDNIGVQGYEVAYGGAQPLRVKDETAVLSGLTPTTAYTVRVTAVDLAGNRSDQSQPLEFSTTDKLPDGGPWDMPRAPFVDYMAWPNPSLPQYAQESGVDGFMLGFIVANNNKKLAWAGQDGPDWEVDQSSYGKKDIQQLAATGGKVAFSCGGASGRPLEAVETSVPRIVEQYEAFLRNYGVARLDFDFEGDFLSDEAAHLRHTAAVSQLLAKHPGLKISYTLPADAQPGEGSAGFSPVGIKFLAKVAAAGIEPGLVNGMLMEFGQSAPPDMYECCVIGLKAMHGQIGSLWPAWDATKTWNRTGATPMFGCNINKRVFTLDNQRSLVEFAHENQLGALSGWDATRDHNQGNPDVQPPCTVGCEQCDTYRCTCVDQRPFDFSKLIALYKNGATPTIGAQSRG